MTSSEVKFQIFICPHCGGCVQVMEGELKCHIFRHGVLKESGTQMNPHETKAECDRLVALGLIFGCGKPFRVIYQEDRTAIAVACDYI
jgi:hypothetical protein